jgi:Dolichyl-phosphate-mannose-protein mannosyltransferase
MRALTEEKSAGLPVRDRGLSPAPGGPPSPRPLIALAEKLALSALAALVIYATARNICHALVRPLWYDEICTLLIAQQKHLSVLWQAVVHGADGQPLAFYLLERTVAAFIHNENLACRGVSILGFAVTLVCLFVAVRTRKGPAIALVCAAIPLATILFDMLAVEARPYSLLVACIAFAIVCYQRVPARRWVILFGLSLVLAQSFHYFAVFAFVPFFLAEAAYCGLTRELRRGVWIALLSGFVPLALFWPALSAMQKYMGPHFWAKPTLELALGSYSWYFLTPEEKPGLYLAAIAGIAVLFTMLAAARKSSRGERPAGAPVHELTLVLGLLGLPLLGFAIAALAHGAMTARYMAPSILGFALALGFTLPTLRHWGFLLPAAIAALLLLMIVPQERQFWSDYNGQFVSPAEFVQDFVTAGGHSDLPVVVSDAHDFLQLQQYCDPAWRKRFVSVLDPTQAVVYTGNDTADQQLAILRRYTALPIYDFQPFLAEHPAFLVYSGGDGLGGDWWPRRLQKAGFKVQDSSVWPRETNDHYHRVFLVLR